MSWWRRTGEAELVEPEFADRVGLVEPTQTVDPKWQQGVIEVRLTGRPTGDVEVRVFGFDRRSLLEGVFTDQVFVWKAEDIRRGLDCILPIPVKLLKG